MGFFLGVFWTLIILGAIVFVCKYGLALGFFAGALTVLVLVAMALITVVGIIVWGLNHR